MRTVKTGGRSRANWVEKGEKNNKYFLNLEKANKNKNTIRSIVRENGEVVKGQKTISNEVKEFYDSLYTNKDVNLSSDDVMTFVDDDAVPKLSYEQQHPCEGLFLLMNVLMCLIHLRIIRSLEMMAWLLNFISSGGIYLGSI